MAVKTSQEAQIESEYDHLLLVFPQHADRIKASKTLHERSQQTAVKS